MKLEKIDVAYRNDLNSFECYLVLKINELINFVTEQEIHISDIKKQIDELNDKKEKQKEYSNNFSGDYSPSMRCAYGIGPIENQSIKIAERDCIPNFHGIGEPYLYKKEQ